MKLLVSRLKSGAYLHLATDWHNYAEQMLLVLNAEVTLKNTSAELVKIETFFMEDVINPEEVPNEFKPTLEQIKSLHAGYVTRPEYRPITKFENRGVKLGHGVWDLIYQKQ